MLGNILILWNIRFGGIFGHFPLYQLLLSSTVWLYVNCSILSFTNFPANFRKKLEDLARCFKKFLDI